LPRIVTNRRNKIDRDYRKYKRLNSLFEHYPTYPGLTTGLPIDIDDWNGSEWIIYYNNLLLNYGIDEAKNVFNKDIKNVGWDAVIYNSGSFDCEFLKFTHQRGLVNYGGITGNLYCGISNTTTTAGTTANNLTKLILPATVIALGLGTMYVYNNYVNK
jgi:hypothetical protein